MDTHDLFKYRREPDKKRLERFVKAFWGFYRERLNVFVDCQIRRDIKRICSRLAIEIRKLRKEQHDG